MLKNSASLKADGGRAATRPRVVPRGDIARERRGLGREGKERLRRDRKVNSDASARLLLAGVGGLYCAGIVRAFSPVGRGLAQAVLEGMVLIVVSLVIYRFLARRASGD